MKLAVVITICTNNSRKLVLEYSVKIGLTEASRTIDSGNL